MYEYEYKIKGEKRHTQNAVLLFRIIGMNIKACADKLPVFSRLIQFSAVTCWLRRCQDTQSNLTRFL